ncbi:glycerophosphodiester phosphodiesterase [Arthrobacter cryoconiti]|uniref:Glycerophosphodiester phosphodiesterase n=1 Tax=Arthrobacter cryoconiti TaxID=748907 RepID=A0ABV8QYA5_9MICC|nr:glycerophosphodiester phosphodiesterase [Arthrobacter cryoconiti]MCC9067390.1 glycerophosphodiester phosphodiesterase [Arthrobacter cryoconiti]
MKHQRQPGKPFLESSVPLAIAHRGFSRDGFENTVMAFKAAQELGYTYLETDINTTVDGVTIVFHDATLERTTGQSGLIAQLPFDVVKKALIGGQERIATLPELFAAMPSARFNIDVKDDGSVAALAQLIEERSLHERVCVASFSDKRRKDVLARLSKPVASSPGQSLLAAYFLLGSWLPARWVEAMMEGVDVLQIPLRFKGLKLVSRRSLERAHRLGLKVHVWTVNEPALVHRLFDLGVDGIMTDRADLLADVMRERGYWA